MNIIFEGDWVKVAGKWSQVVEVYPDDLVGLSRKNDYQGNMVIHAGSSLIEKVLSDLEMQELLLENC